MDIFAHTKAQVRAFIVVHRVCDEIATESERANNKVNDQYVCIDNCNNTHSR